MLVLLGKGGEVLGEGLVVVLLELIKLMEVFTRLLCLLLFMLLFKLLSQLLSKLIELLLMSLFNLFPSSPILLTPNL